MTVSSGPLPLLPMWAMASSVVAGVGLGWGWGGSRERQAGMCTYCICLLYYFIGYPDWRVPNDPWRSGCVRVPLLPFSYCLSGQCLLEYLVSFRVLLWLLG